MPKVLIELLIAIVADFEDAIFDTESVREVLTQRSLGDFDRPAAQVFAIEERHPFRFLGSESGGEESEKGDESKSGHAGHLD
jgi:hypothetical protein